MKPKTHYKHWKPAEDEKLRRAWGDGTIEELAVRLGRTTLSVYSRGRHLGMPCGIPQGYEWLSHAAKRTGFTTSQLRSMMFAARRPVRRSFSRPRPGATASFTFHVVVPDDVDEAVARWSSTEVLTTASTARDVDASTLRRLLIEAGHKPPRGAKRRWRVPTVVIDEVVRAYRELFSVAAHAKRVGLSRGVLAERLRAAGCSRRSALASR